MEMDARNLALLIQSLTSKKGNGHMKKRWTMIIVLIVTSSVFAGFKLPRRSYTIDQLEEAKEKSETTGKPIAFLYSNKNTTCPLAEDASTAMIKALKLRTIIVYLEDWNAAPENVKQALKKRGKYIPRIVVFNSKVDEELGLVTYTEVKTKGRKAFKDLLKKIRKYRKTKK